MLIPRAQMPAHQKVEVLLSLKCTGVPRVSFPVKILRDEPPDLRYVEPGEAAPDAPAAMFHPGDFRQHEAGYPAAGYMRPFAAYGRDLHHGLRDFLF